MTRASRAVTAGAPYRRYEHTYDALSRLVQTRSFDTSAATIPVTTEQYLYNGWNRVAVLQSTGSATPTLRQSYVWGLDIAAQNGSNSDSGGVAALLLITDHSALITSHYPTYDSNGNITALVDAATGTVTARYEYSPFGETTRATGSFAESNPYRYSTKPTSTETGLIYYGYRFYKPKWQTWLNRDPIEEQGGLNLYGFVGNDGVNTIDVLGNYGDWQGFFEWLTGIGAVRTGHRLIEWKDFDPTGNQRASLKLKWKQENRDAIRQQCGNLKAGQETDFKLLGKASLPGTNQEIPWIGDYQSFAEGDLSRANLAIQKYRDETGRCICEIWAELDLHASDRSNFNPGEGFGPGDRIRDDWFIALRDKTPLGHDFIIYAMESTQITWKEKF